jgi:hypothetical protein
MPLSPKANDRVRLLVIATGVAMVTILFILATAALTPELYRRQIDWKWVRFGVVTILFVGYCFKTYWGARKRLGFWVILLGILVFHFLGVGYFYYDGAGLPLLTFGPVVALEWALLAVAVYYFLGIGPQERKR